MPVSLNRNPLRPARGPKAAIVQAAADNQLSPWELVHAVDEDALYIWSGTDLINVGTAAAVLGGKADLDVNGHLLFSQLPQIRLSDLSDLDTAAIQNRSTIVFNMATGKWEATPDTTIDEILNGGNF